MLDRTRAGPHTSKNIKAKGWVDLDGDGGWGSVCALAYRQIEQDWSGLGELVGR